MEQSKKKVFISSSLNQTGILLGFFFSSGGIFLGLTIFLHIQSHDEDFIWRINSTFTCKKRQLLCQLSNNWTRCFVVLLLISIKCSFNCRLGARTICECITKGRAEESFYQRGWQEPTELMKRIRWAPPSATGVLGFIPILLQPHKTQVALRNSIILVK